MVLNELITLMKSLLNKDLNDAINLLKNTNINYAYDIAECRLGDGCIWFYRILSNRRYNKYNNSYIYLAVIKKQIIECKLYQVYKEQVYVVTTLLKYERDNLLLNDLRDIIVLL